MSQSIFCEFSLLILDDNVLRIVDDHHAASVNKPASFEIFCKVLIEQRFDNGVVPVDNEGLILFQRALGEGERWVILPVYIVEYTGGLIKAQLNGSDLCGHRGNLEEIGKLTDSKLHDRCFAI